MLKLCRREQIRLLVPTIDTELPVYAALATPSPRKTLVAISAPETVAIGNDKCRTHDWLVEHGFPTVAQRPVEEVIAQGHPDWPFPLIAKPQRGSA